MLLGPDEHRHRLPHMSLAQRCIPYRGTESAYPRYACVEMARGNYGAVRAADREAARECGRLGTRQHADVRLAS